MWWHSFLPKWNGTAPFLEVDVTDAYDWELYTDASGALGCGAFWQSSWQPHQRLSKTVSI